MTSYTHKDTKLPFTKRTTKNLKKKHQKNFFSKHCIGWSKKNHYMAIGGQCGQSCPCCRAGAFKSGTDKDGWFGACPICLSKK